MRTDLRVYRVINGETQCFPVRNPQHAIALIDALSKSDLLADGIDYNCYGLEQYNEVEDRWEEWEDKNGDDIENTSLRRKVIADKDAAGLHQMTPLELTMYKRYNPDGRTYYGLYYNEDTRHAVIAEVGIMTDEDIRNSGNDWMELSGVQEGLPYSFKLHSHTNDLYETQEEAEEAFFEGDVDIDDMYRW